MDLRTSTNLHIQNVDVLKANISKEFENLDKPPHSKKTSTFPFPPLGEGMWRFIFKFRYLKDNKSTNMSNYKWSMKAEKEYQIKLSQLGVVRYKIEVENKLGKFISGERDLAGKEHIFNQLVEEYQRLEKEFKKSKQQEDAKDERYKSGWRRKLSTSRQHQDNMI